MWSEGGEPQTQKYVARLKPTRPGVFPDYDIDLQFEVMRALGAATDVPVPEMLWQEHDPEVLGTSFFVMGHVEGRIPVDNPPYTVEGWVLELPEDEQHTLQTAGMDTMCQVHRIDWQAAVPFLVEGGRVPNGFDEQLAYYERYFDWALEGGPNPTATAALEWLYANRPSGSLSTGLSWGDSRISNMVFGPDLHPVAVLDWEMVSVGDPEMDLGWWLFLDRHFTEGLGAPMPAGFVGRDELVKRWEAGTGRTADNVDFWEVFAGFRFAVVMMRLVTLLKADGQMPPDSDFDRSNLVTWCLAPMIGAPDPRGAA